MKSFNSTSMNYLSKQKCSLEENFLIQDNSKLRLGFISYRTQEGTTSLTRYNIQDVWCYLTTDLDLQDQQQHRQGT